MSFLEAEKAIEDHFNASAWDYRVMLEAVSTSTWPGGTSHVCGTKAAQEAETQP